MENVAPSLRALVGETVSLFFFKKKSFFAKINLVCWCSGWCSIDLARWQSRQLGQSTGQYCSNPRRWKSMYCSVCNFNHLRMWFLTHSLSLCVSVIIGVVQSVENTRQHTQVRFVVPLDVHWSRLGQEQGSHGALSRQQMLHCIASRFFLRHTNWFVFLFIYFFTENR